MKVLNFGSLNIDHVYSLPHIVREGETLDSDGFQIFCGGKGLNQSIALARAGVKVFHAGCVGNDGDMLVSILEDNGVDTTFLEKIDAKNGHAIIQVSKKGENCIFLYAGTNSLITKEHVEKTLSAFEKGDVLLLQNEINDIGYIVKKAHEKGMKVILNPSPIKENIREIDFNMLDYLVLNEVEAGDISGYNEVDDILTYFKTNYPNLKLMLTLGKKGCVYMDNKEQVFQPIFKVEAVDTTAAGDTFTGYFIRGIVQGEPVKKILEIASRASSIAVSRMGAAPSIPSIEEVL